MHIFYIVRKGVEHIPVSISTSAHIELSKDLKLGILIASLCLELDSRRCVTYRCRVVEGRLDNCRVVDGDEEVHIYLVNVLRFDVRQLLETYLETAKLAISASREQK